ncbi:MAG: T9SS type A sorting domain-containing protein [Bacteroidales bacterium]
MKKKFYSLLVLSFLVITGTGFLSKLNATPIDSLNAVITPLSCFGTNDGEIDITVYGGTSPYNYFWNDGSSLQDRTNLQIGTYSVTVYDSDGHLITGSYLVTQPDPLLLESVVAPVTCYGANNGGIDLIVSGGTTPYTYSWSNGSTEEDLSGLTAGVYTVTVTDINECQLSGDILVPGTEATFELEITVFPVSCFEGSNGTILVNMEGGLSPYTFLWNDGSTDQNRTDIPAGQYYVTVTDALGACSAAPSAITQPAQLLVSAAFTDVTCYQSSTGGIDLTVTGGTFPYFYSWSNGAVTQDLINITAGVYSVTVTDNAGCTNEQGPFVIIDPPQLVITYSSGNVTCNGGQDGYIDALVSGGVQPYSYLWNNGETTAYLSVIQAGIYTLTVTDANNCQQIQQVTITQPDPITPNETLQNVNCFNAGNGYIQVAPTGGTSPYTYLWNTGSEYPVIFNLGPGAYSVTITDNVQCTAAFNYNIQQPEFLWLGGNVTNVSCLNGNDGEIEIFVFGGTSPYSFLWNDGFTTQNRTGLLIGSYTVTVTDYNNCTYSATFDVEQPDPYSFTQAITNVSCFAGNNGAIDIEVSGGTPPYSYLWSNGSTDQDISGLTAGTYAVTVSDDFGCIGEASFIVTEPALLTVTGTQTNVSCPGGSDGTIQLLLNGGTETYTYLWNDNSTDQDRTGLMAGDYLITVTDALGCIATNIFSISQPGIFEFNESITNLSCYNSGDGSITVNLEGGSSPYTVLWSTGSTDAMITDLTAGDYHIDIADNNGCTASATFTVTEPELLASDYTSTQVSCNGFADGSIDLTTSGGTEPYAWEWNTAASTEDISGIPAGTYTITITDANGCIVSNTITITEPDQLVIGSTLENNLCYNGQLGTITIAVDGGTPSYSYLWEDNSIDPDRTGLAAGNYFITVTDLNGCTATASYTISEPAQILVLTATPTNVSCYGGNDGAINLEISGGTPDYTYLWSNGESTQDVQDLIIGTYTVTVTDNDGYCSVISASLIEPDPLTLTVEYVLPSCFGYDDGTINISVSDGTFPYTFEWTGGSTDEDLINVAAGTYFVTITDNNGCEFETSFTLEQPTEVEISAIVTTISCNGAGDGAIQITTSGGNPDYSWEWSNGETTESIENLIPDTYYLTVTDDHGCTLSEQFIITEPDVLIITEDLLTNVTCHGDLSGEIALTTSGGTLDYTFLWSDGAFTEDRTGIADGTYTLTVTDARGCTATGIYTLTATFTIEITADIVDVSCLTGSTGSITATATGGTDPYTYTWNDGFIGNERTGLAPGDYTVTALDDIGCSQTATFTVGQVDNITITGVVNNITCFGARNGRISVSASGGISPYFWEWSNGSTDTLIIDLEPGFYTVTVTDQIGCFTSETFKVTQPDPMTGNLSPMSQVLYCSGDELTPVVFTADFYPESSVTYSWNRNKVTQVSGLPASGTGVISGNLTNNTTIDQQVIFNTNVFLDGCFASNFTVYVYVAAALQINFNYEELLCHGETTQVQIQAVGGVPPYTGEQTVTLGAGTYSYTITDNYNCSVTSSLEITEPPAINITGIVYPGYCSNQPNAAVDMSVTGGVPPYSYLWSDGNTNQDRSGLVAGYYAVSVTDANDCIETHVFNVGAFYTAPMGYLAGSPIGCYGQANPLYIYLSGTPPWNVTYTRNGIPTTVTNIYTTTYTFYATITQSTTFELVSLTDAHCSGNVTSQPLTMTVVQPPSASFVPTQPICKGQTSNITVNLNGTPPFTLTWYNGTPHTVTNILSNTYTIVSTPQTTTQYSIQSLSDVYCFSGSSVTPVFQIVYPLPTATITGNAAICAGNTAAIQVAFTGNPPWSFTYNNGTSLQTINNINVTPYNLILSPNVTTYYTPVAVSDFRCSGTVSGQATILVHPRPTATWTGPDSACFNTNVSLPLVLTGSPPWSLTWNDGVPHTINNIMFNPYIVNSLMNINKTFTVTQLSDAFCQANNPAHFGAPKTVTVHALPTGTMTGPDINCYGIGTDLEVNLTGTPPWTVNWYDGANINTINNITETPYLIHVDPADTTLYFLTSVSDAFCLGQVLGLPVELSVSPAPVLVIPGLEESNSICEGTVLNLTTNFTDGIGPFTLNYLDAAGDFQSVSGLVDGSPITFSPPPFSGGYLFTLQSVTGSNGCEVPINLTFTIKVIPAPTIFAGNDTAVTLGDQFMLIGTIDGGVPPYSVLWSPPDYLDDPTSINPVCSPLADIIYTLSVIDSIGCEVFDQIDIQVDMSRNIFGYLTYDNEVHTPLNNVLVKAMNLQNVVVDSTYTDAAGYYSLVNLPDGEYKLKCFTTIPYGGVNATDALLTLKHFVGQTQLTGLRKLACDVNGSGFINSVDALSISLRFTQQITSFPIGDWYFQNVSFTIPTSLAQYDVKVLCSGDANGSYNPVSKTEPSVSLTGEGILMAESYKDLIIPVRVNNTFDVGAISLVLNYPEEALTIHNVSLSNGDKVEYTATNGELRISWYSLDALRLNSHEVLLNITSSLNTDHLNQELLFWLGDESEISDQKAIPFANAGIIIPKISLDMQSLTLSVNYPNPFSLTTTISYSVPEDGRVKMTVLDAMGREIAVPVNEHQSAGNYTITFDGSKLPEGIYLYRLDYNNSKQERSLIQKMTLLR